MLEVSHDNLIGRGWTWTLLSQKIAMAVAMAAVIVGLFHRSKWARDKRILSSIAPSYVHSTAPIRIRTHIRSIHPHQRPLRHLSPVLSKLPWPVTRMYSGRPKHQRRRRRRRTVTPTILRPKHRPCRATIFAPPLTTTRTITWSSPNRFVRHR